MVPKRKQDSQGRPSGSNKRPRKDYQAAFGQRAFLPVVDGNGHVTDDRQDGGAVSQDAMTYLQSVRTEADSIPNVLLAETTFHAEEDGPDELGHAAASAYYSDGAYVAAPLISHASCGAPEEVDELLEQGPEYDDEDDDGSDEVPAREVYDDLLRMRFMLLRTKLRRKPPDSVVQTLDTNSHPIAFTVTKRHPFRERTERWRHLLSSSTPKPAQLAAMDQRSVLMVLEVLTKHLTSNFCSNKNQVRYASAWIWGLLAKIDDLGTLSSEEVSIVRELAKKAGSLVRSICQAKERMMRRQEQILSGETYEDIFDEDAESEEAVAGYEWSDEEAMDGWDDEDDAPTSELQGKPFHAQNLPTAQKVESAALEMQQRMLCNSSSPPPSSAPARVATTSDQAPRLSPPQGPSSISGQANSANLQSSEPHSHDPTKDCNFQYSNQDAAVDKTRETPLEDINPELGATSQPEKFTGLSNQQEVAGSREAAEKAAMALLDMIILLVGDQYGQRDLLGVRERIWGVCGAGMDSAEE